MRPAGLPGKPSEEMGRWKACAMVEKESTENRLRHRARSSLLPSE
jgi:hypothetical protein